MKKTFVVTVYKYPLSPQEFRLEGPFDSIEKAQTYAQKMTELWGTALVRRVHEPKPLDK